MKALYSGITALGLVFASTASAQSLDDLNDIGDMATGIYQIDDTSNSECYLAVGNYRTGKSGRGYAAISCIDGFDWDNVSSISKIVNTDIGDMATGQHVIDINGTDCHLFLGNYRTGQSGRGYAAMDCAFE